MKVGGSPVRSCARARRAPFHHFPLYFQLINVISVSREQDVRLVADIRAAGHIEFNTKPRSHGDEHQKCSHAQLSQEAGRS